LLHTGEKLKNRVQKRIYGHKKNEETGENCKRRTDGWGL
jgi:hypothetical protein